MERPVAPIGRAAVSKAAWWGFESLLACQIRTKSGYLGKADPENAGPKPAR